MNMQNRQPKRLSVRVVSGSRPGNVRNPSGRDLTAVRRSRAREYFISKTFDENGSLCYIHPELKNKIAVHGVTRESLAKNGLFTFTEPLISIKRVEIEERGVNRLVFLRYCDNAEARREIEKFARFNADAIADAVLGRRMRIARLFANYYFDDEKVDFSLFVGTDELVGMMSERGFDVDNIVNYPNNCRIVGYNETFRIMLLCAPDYLRDRLFHVAVDIMIERVRARLLGSIDKTDDFSFIE